MGNQNQKFSFIDEKNELRNSRKYKPTDKMNRMVSNNKFFLQNFIGKERKREKKKTVDLKDESQFCQEFLQKFIDLQAQLNVNQISNFYHGKKKHNSPILSIRPSHRLQLLKKTLFEDDKSQDDNSTCVASKLLKMDLDYNIEKVNKKDKKAQKSRRSSIRKLQKISQISQSSYRKNKSNQNKCTDQQNNIISLINQKKQHQIRESKAQNEFDSIVRETDNLEDTIVRASMENKFKREQFFKENSKNSILNESIELENINQIKQSLRDVKPIKSQSSNIKPDKKQNKHIIPSFQIPKKSFQNLLKKQKNLNQLKRYSKNKSNTSFFDTLMEKHRKKSMAKQKNLIQKKDNNKNLFEYNSNHLLNNLNHQLYQKTSYQDLKDEKNFQSTNQSSKESNKTIFLNNLSKQKIKFNSKFCFKK